MLGGGCVILFMAGMYSDRVQQLIAVCIPIGRTGRTVDTHCPNQPTPIVEPTECRNVYQYLLVEPVEWWNVYRYL